MKKMGLRMAHLSEQNYEGSDRPSSNLRDCTWRTGILTVSRNVTFGLFSDSKNIYIGKQFFLSSGYGFPMTKGSLLRDHFDKW